jgi:hypothetical protein
MHLCIVGFDADRLPIGSNRLFELALTGQGYTEVGMSLGMVRFNADRLPKRGNCLLKLALTGQGYTEVVRRRDVVCGSYVRSQHW